jgi:hypothetical protein
MKQEITDYFLESLSVFADNLHYLAFDKPTEGRLLMVLSNTAHTKNVIIRDVIYAFVGAFRRAKQTTHMKEIDFQISATEQTQTETENQETEVEEETETRSDDDDDKASDSSSSSSAESEDETTERENDEQSVVAEIEKEVEELSAQFQSQEHVNLVMHLYDKLCVFVVDRFVALKARTMVRFVEKVWFCVRLLTCVFRVFC